MGEVVENGKIVETLKELVEIESVSKKEHDFKRFLRDRLSALGYRIVESEHFIATDSNSDLVVATHIDTVPIRRRFSFDGTFAYGTGVCDPKASVVSMLIAAEIRPLNYSLAFFCDEEEDGTGSLEFSNKWKKSKYVIVMEPTELKIASRHFGNFEVMVDVEGKEVHASLYEAGENAIEKALELIREFKSKMKANVLEITGGGGIYVVPGTCKVRLEVFLEPGEKLKHYFRELEFLRRFGKYRIENAYEGYISGDIVKYLEEALKNSNIQPLHTSIRSWTDALNLKSRFDVVVWGPGELVHCHTEEERIGISEIRKAIEVLLKLSESLI